MQIEVKFLCKEIVGDLKSGSYTIPENATIKDLFEICQKENQLKVNEKYLNLLVFLADGKPATWSTCLNNINKVYVLRSVVGG